MMEYEGIARAGAVSPRRGKSLGWFLGVVLLGVSIGARTATAQLPSISIQSIGLPPAWALLQRHLLEEMFPAAEEFLQTYTRPDGTLIWRDEWPGMDGSDDGYESFYNFPLYYALGGPAELLPLSHKLWNAVTRQFTDYGQVYREFDGYYDWMHHGESYVNFYFFGLADPEWPGHEERARRFAGFYVGEDAEAANWDTELKLIRSPITGSRGPRFVNSAEDWVTHREVLAHYPLPYDDIPHVKESGAWTNEDLFPYILDTMNRRMMRGDVPLNLTATSLVLHAYALTGEDKYRHWITDYVDAWMERVRKNNGILPDNVGLSGEIGEYMDGKWWGGYYGWRWPHGLFNQLEATLIGGANALLATGDPYYLDLPRSVLDLVEKVSRTEDGRVLLPNRHNDSGWYDFRPIREEYLIHLWYLSQDPDDYARLERMTHPETWNRLHYSKRKGDFGHSGSWLRFLQGDYPEYPEAILRATYAETLRRLEMVRNDTSDPKARNVHHWQQRNPVVLEGLVQTMLGGPNHIYHGGLLHCRLRYFDPEARRAGIPPDVAALVDELEPNRVSVWLVNVHPTEPRRVILQAGAFGEHRFREVSTANTPSEGTEPANGRWFEVRLRPGAMGHLNITMDRYVNPPSYRSPWR